MYGKSVLAVLVFVFTFGVNMCFGGESFWPMFQRDPGHTGLAPVSVSTNPRILWKMTAPNLYDSHLLLGEDGSLWTVGDYAVTNVGRFGGVRFRIKTGPSEGLFANVQGAAAVLPDGGLVCVGSHTGTTAVYKLNKEAGLTWSLDLEGDAGGKSLLTLGYDGAIYVGLGSLYAISPEGRLLWSYQPPAAITAVPAVGTSGTVYVGCHGAIFCAIDPPGVLKWSYDAGAPTRDSCAPTIDGSGNVYFLSSKTGLFAFRSDGSPIYSYPGVGYCYTSPVVLPDGSIALLCDSGLGPFSYLVHLEQDGTERWKTQIPGRTIMVSPIADQDANTYVACFSGDPPTFTFYLGRVDASGTFDTLYAQVGQGGLAGLAGPCISSEGTIYCWMDNCLLALGEPTETAIGVSTDPLSVGNSPGSVVTVSLSLMNPGDQRDADCYLAYRRADDEALWFWPFWLSDPNMSVLGFTPLPHGAYFPEVDLARLGGDRLQPGTYQALTGLFEPGTFNPIAEIAWTLFDVTPATPSASNGQAAHRGQSYSTASDASVSVSLATDKATYHAGEVLDLSLSFENLGEATDSDLYIAATLDGDPSGTLYFFPTWATNPGMTNISFQPLAQGASLPYWTIMHLELPDALPRGGYKFLAAFFQVGTFTLASDIAEAHWTLM